MVGITWEFESLAEEIQRRETQILLIMMIKMEDKFWNPNPNPNQPPVNKVLTDLKTHVNRASSENDQISCYLDVFQIEEEDLFTTSRDRLPDINKKDLIDFSTFARDMLSPSCPEVNNTLKNERLVTMMVALRNYFASLGGFESLLSRNLFRESIKGFIEKYRTTYFGDMNHTLKKYFTLYKNMILPFDFSQQRLATNPRRVDIGYPVFLNADDFRMDVEEGKWEDLLTQDIFCIEDAVSSFALDSSIFRLEIIAQTFPVLRGKVTSMSELKYNIFNPSTVGEMSVKDYYHYLSKTSNLGPNEMNTGYILELQGLLLPVESIWLLEIEKKIPFPLLFRSPMNALYHPLPIESSHPLTVYVSPMNSWRPVNTLHLQQSCIVDINHGPGDYFWSAVSLKHLAFLRRVILNQLGIDVFVTPIVPDHYLLMKNGVPVTRMLQKPGSCLYMGSGMIFWGEAQGTSIHTSWNILPITRAHFRKLSYLGSIQVQPVFPLKKIVFNILNFNVSNQALTTYLLKLASMWMREEEIDKEKIVINSMKEIEVGVRGNLAVESCGKCQREMVSFKFEQKETRVVWCSKCVLTAKWNMPEGEFSDSSMIVAGLLWKLQNTKRIICSPNVPFVTPTTKQHSKSPVTLHSTEDSTTKDTQLKDPTLATTPQPMDIETLPTKSMQECQEPSDVKADVPPTKPQIASEVVQELQEKEQESPKMEIEKEPKDESFGASKDNNDNCERTMRRYNYQSRNNEEQRNNIREGGHNKDGRGRQNNHNSNNGNRNISGNWRDGQRGNEGCRDYPDQRSNQRNNDNSRNKDTNRDSDSYRNNGHGGQRSQPNNQQRQKDLIVKFSPEPQEGSPQPSKPPRDNPNRDNLQEHKPRETPKNFKLVSYRKNQNPQDRPL